MSRCSDVFQYIMQPNLCRLPFISSLSLVHISVSWGAFPKTDHLQGHICNTLIMRNDSLRKVSKFHHQNGIWEQFLERASCTLVISDLLEEVCNRPETVEAGVLHEKLLHEVFKLCSSSSGFLAGAGWWSRRPRAHWPQWFHCKTLSYVDLNSTFVECVTCLGWLFLNYCQLQTQCPWTTSVSSGLERESISHRHSFAM